MKIFGALAFALIAALGNAVFAVGQKKAVLLENPMLFIIMAAVVCIVLTLTVAPLFGRVNIVDTVRINGFWAVVSGVGLFFTYVGFNFLYSRYGASQYTLYAVLSIITTSIVVGVVLFREPFNLYHKLALLSAVVTVLLYSVGQSRL